MGSLLPMVSISRFHLCVGMYGTVFTPGKINADFQRFFRSQRLESA
jgi:hypothetical protein